MRTDDLQGRWVHGHDFYVTWCYVFFWGGIFHPNYLYNHSKIVLAMEMFLSCPFYYSNHRHLNGRGLNLVVVQAECRTSFWACHHPNWFWVLKTEDLTFILTMFMMTLSFVLVSLARKNAASGNTQRTRPTHCAHAGCARVGCGCASGTARKEGSRVLCGRP